MVRGAEKQRRLPAAALQLKLRTPAAFIVMVRNVLAPVHAAGAALAKLIWLPARSCHCVAPPTVTSLAFRLKVLPVKIDQVFNRGRSS